MTNEEAMCFFESVLKTAPTNLYTNSSKVAIIALKKQIPEKPIPHIVEPVEAPIKIGCGRWGKGTTVYKCPNCGEWVSRVYKHCPACGQALDWSGEE
ncbi:MAG: hypothetical protein ACI4XH_07920 [Acutalibacteraceae bacterium]